MYYLHVTSYGCYYKLKILKNPHFLLTLPDISSFLDEIFVPNISKKTQAENIRGIKTVLIVIRAGDHVAVLVPHGIVGVVGILAVPNHKGYKRSGFKQLVKLFEKRLLEVEITPRRKRIKLVMPPAIIAICLVY